MKIIGVQAKDYASSIPLPDLDSVKGALRLFETGKTRSSGATQRLGIGQVGGGMASMLLALVGDGGSRFLENLLVQMEADLSARGLFYGSYDYDGPGVFHKTSVQVNKTSEKNAPYTLSLRAAYVGDEVEIGLAESLGIERGFMRTEVQVELAPVGVQFEIDLDLFASRLRPLSRVVPKAEEMVEALAGKSDHAGAVDLSHLGLTIELLINTMSVGGFYDFRTDQKLWTRDGNIIRGPLRESYERRGQFENPMVVIEVAPAHGGHRSPVFDLPTKTRIRGMAAKIASAMQPS